MCAALCGHTDCVQVLLEAGANTNATDRVREMCFSDRLFFNEKRRIKIIPSIVYFCLAKYYIKWSSIVSSDF
jgi:hypothetical protein